MIVVTEHAQVICPGCGASIRPTTKSHDSEGKHKESIIPAHNPLPGNTKKADYTKECPGSGKSAALALRIR